MKSYAKPEYDSSVKNFPAGLCSTCRYIIVLLISSYHSNFRINLNSCKKGVDWDSIGRTDPRIKWSNFHLIKERYDPKTHDKDNCKICFVARWNPVGKGKTSLSLPPRDIDTISNSTKVSEKKICTKCRQDIGRGIPHPCTANFVKQNIVHLISKELISR